MSASEDVPENALPSERDVARYWEHGYWVAPRLFDATRVAALRAAVEEVYARPLADSDYPLAPPFNRDKPHAVKTLMFGWRLHETIRALASDPALTAIAAALMRTPRVRLWQDQLIWKPPVDGAAARETNIGLHQDYAYWQDSSTTNMITANVALQDTSEHNGAMRVVVGSHALGLLPWASSFFDTDLEKLRGMARAESRGELREQVFTLEAGQVTFHHALLLHGSGPNYGAQPRLAIAIGYAPDGIVIRDDGQPPSLHLLRLLDARVPGAPIAGPSFPLVYDANAPRERKFEA
jgi:ectoine hydroxylase-related dioxygenase (phytanoyl-CoA dioxygenase family)